MTRFRIACFTPGETNLYAGRSERGCRIVTGKFLESGCLGSSHSITLFNKANAPAIKDNNDQRGWSWKGIHLFTIPKVWRGPELHRRSPGYEPGEILLLHPALCTSL